MKNNFFMDGASYFFFIISLIKDFVNAFKAFKHAFLRILITYYDISFLGRIRITTSQFWH